MLSTDDFYRLVFQMRNEQKNYFRTRSRESLAKSKVLEKRVDAQIMEYDAENDIS